MTVGNRSLERLGPLIDILKVLVRQPSVVGAEHAFFRVLQRELEERGAKVTWYEGVLVAQGSRPQSAMLSAHVDRHGLVCTGPNEFQYAAFVSGRRSDLLGNSVSEKLMCKVAGRFRDVPVVAYEPWSGAYLGRGTIVDSHVSERRKNLIFNVDGLNHLRAGTPVAFSDRLRIEDGLFSAQLDNVLTVAVLLYLFECGFQGTAFFTAQEEAGSSWRYLLEWFMRFGSETNSLVVVDTSPFPDRASADAQSVVLRRRDANACFDAESTDALAALCTQMHIPYIFKDSMIDEQNAKLASSQEAASYGSTEMGRIISASAGLVTGTTLQIPTTGYHTMHESANADAIFAFVQVLQAWVEQV